MTELEPKLRSESNLTFVKKKLDPDIVSQLTNIETKSHHYYKKLYECKKYPTKALKCFYEPKAARKT